MHFQLMVKKNDGFTGTLFKTPVVVVVGHIDHGKTTLLDKIRETSVAAKEAGGITQHIGASQIEFKTKDNSLRKITFLDTPGHSAFLKMRGRGAEAADVVILVVAADAGVQEQTKESLRLIEEAKVPYLVALNKIDLPTADINRVKGELVEAGAAPEDYGGKIVTVPVSAKTGEGIPQLLEMISLIADLKEKKPEIKGEFLGVVIEASFDSKKGPLATVLVKSGELFLGEEIFAEDIKAKIRGMKNWRGLPVDKAIAGDAVEIFGFEKTPTMGAIVGRLEVGSGKKEEKMVSQEEEKVQPVLKVLVKADTKGTLEALCAGLPKEAQIISSGVGELNDSDIFLAQSLAAEIFVFNIKLSAAAQSLIKQTKIPVFSSKIIYEIFDEVKKRVQKKLDPMFGLTILGKAEIIAEFKIKDKKIAGCKVKEGEIMKNGKALIFRNDQKIGETVITSLRHQQEEIDKATGDTEFGAVFSPFLDFSVGDSIINYKVSE